jgi:hypothetical protein
MNFLFSAILLFNSYATGFLKPFNCCSFCNDTVSTFNGSVSIVNDEYVFDNMVLGYNCFVNYRDESCSINHFKSAYGLVDWKYVVHSLVGSNHSCYNDFIDNLDEILTHIVNNETSDYICHDVQSC